MKGETHGLQAVKVLENRKLSRDFHLLRVESPNKARMGQFYMLRAWEEYPVLSRPISVFDSDGQTVSFLCKVVGKGTRRLAALQPGDTLGLLGPLGSTIPSRGGRIALVGGGVGIAPLYLAAKTLKAEQPDSRVDVYLGFSDVALLEEEYRRVADGVAVNVGGFVTDGVDPAAYDFIFACGPDAMMRVLYGKCAAAGAEDRLWVSLENRMACGIGACLVCSCKTAEGNRRACKDGPVFPGKAVFGL